MYPKIRMSNNTHGLKNTEITEGETIETKISRIITNKEPIKDGAPITYTERKDGVQPQYNIKTDRFEIALDAMDKVAKSRSAQRAAKAEGKIIDINTKKDTGGEPIQPTGQEPK